MIDVLPMQLVKPFRWPATLRTNIFSQESCCWNLTEPVAWCSSRLVFSCAWNKGLRSCSYICLVSSYCHAPQTSTTQTWKTRTQLLFRLPLSRDTCLKTLSRLYAFSLRGSTFRVSLHLSFLNRYFITTHRSSWYNIVACDLNGLNFLPAFIKGWLLSLLWVWGRKNWFVAEAIRKTFV